MRAGWLRVAVLRALRRLDVVVRHYPLHAILLALPVGLLMLAGFLANLLTRSSRTLPDDTMISSVSLVLRPARDGADVPPFGHDPASWWGKARAERLPAVRARLRGRLPALLHRDACVACRPAVPGSGRPRLAERQADQHVARRSRPAKLDATTLVRRAAARASISSSIGCLLVVHPDGTVRQPATAAGVPDIQFLVIEVARYIVSRQRDPEAIALLH